MTEIYTTATVSDTRSSVFDVAVGRILARFQAEGLICDVQFSTASGPGYIVNYSALILARKASS